MHEILSKYHVDVISIHCSDVQEDLMFAFLLVLVCKYFLRLSEFMMG